MALCIGAATAQRRAVLREMKTNGRHVSVIRLNFWKIIRGYFWRALCMPRGFAGRKKSAKAGSFVTSWSGRSVAGRIWIFDSYYGYVDPWMMSRAARCQVFTLHRGRLKTYNGCRALASLKIRSSFSLLFFGGFF